MRRETLQEGTKIGVEMQFTETGISSFVAAVGTLVAPQANKFGRMHAQLEVFGMLVEWGGEYAGSSIVYPRVSLR